MYTERVCLYACVYSQKKTQKIHTKLHTSRYSRLPLRSVMQNLRTNWLQPACISFGHFGLARQRGLFFGYRSAHIGTLQALYNNRGGRRSRRPYHRLAVVLLWLILTARWGPVIIVVVIIVSSLCAPPVGRLTIRALTSRFRLRRRIWRHIIRNGALCAVAPASFGASCKRVEQFLGLATARSCVDVRRVREEEARLARLARLARVLVRLCAVC